MARLDQVIIVVTAAILVVVGALVASVGIGGVSHVMRWARFVPGLWEGILIAAILVLLAIYLLQMVMRQKGEPAVVHQAELGAVRIGVTTIKGLINKKARDMEGVKDCVVTVVQTEPLQVQIELQILPDFNVPRLAEELQLQVKEYMADTMGIEVASVEILVRGIGGSAKPRVS